MTILKSVDAILTEGKLTDLFKSDFRNEVGIARSLYAFCKEFDVVAIKFSKRIQPVIERDFSWKSISHDDLMEQCKSFDNDPVFALKEEVLNRDYIYRCPFREEDFTIRFDNVKALKIQHHEADPSLDLEFRTAFPKPFNIGREIGKKTYNVMDLDKEVDVFLALHRHKMTRKTYLEYRAEIHQGVSHEIEKFEKFMHSF